MNDENGAGCDWTARRLQPIVLLWVVAVFAVLTALAVFVFQSRTGVKALIVGAVGFLVPLVPQVLSRVDYRLRERVLERRTRRREEPEEFETFIEVDDLSHVVPVRHGFKFYRPIDGPGAFRRFWKRHVSDRYSGEVHVERPDQPRVFAALRELGVDVR
jgi:hypothetical protein